MISIVRGNDFTLKIPVEIQRIENGSLVVEPFDLTDAKVTVNISNGFKLYKFNFTTEWNVVVIPINGNTIGNGIYNVEIIALKGDNYRSCKLSQFKIVDTNEESNIISYAELESNIHQLDSHVLFDFSSNIISKLSDLFDVDNSVNFAENGSLLSKSGKKWVSISPFLSNNNDYDNMIMPVYHNKLKKWVFISVSSMQGGVDNKLVMVLDNGILDQNILL